MGTLYLVATPIGNLEDITLRALRILGEVQLIAAEDTRHTRKLLSHYDLHTPLKSYHEHNQPSRLAEVVAALESGDVALVSDAGTPGLSDPGYELVVAAWEAGHTVSPVPGPSAPIAALVASGLPSDAFVYLGYLPRKQTERRALLESLRAETRTVLAFEVPHRLAATLAEIEATLGSGRPLVICRELTKLHEEILRGTAAELRSHFQAAEPRGEITLVIGGAAKSERWDEVRVRAALAQQLAAGLPPSQAAREVAAAAGWPRRDVYRLTTEDA